MNDKNIKFDSIMLRIIIYKALVSCVQFKICTLQVRWLLVNMFVV